MDKMKIMIRKMVISLAFVLGAAFFLGTAIVHAKDVSTWSQLYDALQEGGNVKLTKDVKYGEGGGDHSSTPLEISGNKTVTLDLNGHVIDRGLKNSAAIDSGFVIRVNIEAELSIRDSNPSTVHTSLIAYDKPGSGENVTVNGGVITGGNSSDSASGLVCPGTLKMYGGTICCNRSGSAVYVFYSGHFYMYGGSVCGNDAGYGAVSLNTGHFEIYGGSVCDNKTSGVYADIASSVEVYGGVIENNKAGQTDSNICGRLTDHFESNFIWKSGTIKTTSCDSSQMTGQVYLSVVDNSLGIEGLLYMTNLVPTGSYIRSDTDLTNLGVDNETRYYQLIADRTGDNKLASPVNIHGTVYLDLNGHILDRGMTSNGNSDGSVINISTKSALKLTDSRPEETHSPKITYKDPIEGGNVTVNGGIITGGWSDEGGGINTGVGAGIYIYGGSICKNRSKAGGGINIGMGQTASTIEMHGGAICGNISDKGGGICALGPAGFYMFGGLISGNSVEYSSDSEYSGGGLYVRGTFTMSGGEISGNTVTKAGSGKDVFGGGVFLCGSMNLSGSPVIKDNKKIVTSSGSAAPISDNLYICDSKRVSCTKGLAPDAEIHIMVQTPPTGNNEAVFTKDLDDDATKKLCNAFISDNEHYVVLLSGTEAALKRRTYRIDFAANGGSGSMASVTVTDGDTYTFPTCTLTPPENKAFDHWTMTGVDGDFQVGGTVTIAPNCELGGAIKVTAHWKDAPTPPDPPTPPTPPDPKPVSVETIELNINKLSLECGQTIALNATISPENATDKTLTWKSSKPKVATVSSSGVITGKSRGTTTITVTSSNGKSASCSVKVKEYKDIKRVCVLPLGVNLKPGKSKTVRAIILPTKAKNKRVAWKSSNTNVATVEAVSGSKAKIVAVRKGKAKITVTTLDGNKKWTVRVTVRK
ncbi:MAG: Ig domain-containing protein [Lachnospiraceae bacterium]|nr:Ig domain-containing protein [Lachnospiraceae bacterium]